MQRGMTLALGVLNKIWPNLNDGFGLLMATGFYGGHGTAAKSWCSLQRLRLARVFDLEMLRLQWD